VAVMEVYMEVEIEIERCISSID